MKIKQSDIPLITAFIAAEASDYRPPKSEEWRRELMKSLLKKTAPLKNPNYLVLTSSNNTSLSRALVLDVREGTNRHNYQVNFCPCGRINHSLMVKRLEGTRVPGVG